MLKKRQRLQFIVLLAVDIILISAAFCIAYLVRFKGFSGLVEKFSVQMVIALGAFLVSFFVFDVYDIRDKFKTIKYLTRFIASAVFAAVIIMVTSYILPFWKTGRGLILLFAGLVFVLIFLWRLFFEWIYLNKIRRRSIVILGAGNAGRYICDIINEDRYFTPVGFLDDDPQKHGLEVRGLKVLGDSSLLRKLIDNKEIDAIVVGITHEKRAELLKYLLYAKMAAVEIYDFPKIYEDITGRLPVMHLRDGWIVFTSFRAMNRSIYTQIKRVIDIIFALAGLILSIPIMILTAIAIKLDSPGPVLFRQKRVGLNGKNFTIFKFRSMYINAEKNGYVFAKENDSRVTRVGSFLRKSRVDEIPQLWNILFGDMSFVGPRPERPEFVTDFEKKIPYYGLRHIVKPGLTGWAQVRWRYGASEADALEKLTYDMYYLKNISFLLDMQIILKTINVVLSRELGR